LISLVFIYLILILKCYWSFINIKLFNIFISDGISNQPIAYSLSTNITVKKKKNKDHRKVFDGNVDLLMTIFYNN